MEAPVLGMLETHQAVVIPQCRRVAIPDNRPEAILPCRHSKATDNRTIRRISQALIAVAGGLMVNQFSSPAVEINDRG